MKPIVLSRSDIGFGKVVIDDTGVRRRGLVRSRAITWSDISAYALTIEMLHANPDAAALGRMWPFEEFAEVGRAMRGESPRRFGLALAGRGQRVFFNWRFQHHDDAIRVILARLEPELLKRAHAELAQYAHIGFGRLKLRADAVGWDRKPPLVREQVESIELFDQTDVRLRIMQRDKVLPYASIPTRDIPNLGTALALAASLGFPIKNRELLP